MYKLIIGNHLFDTLVAKTHREHERGLMFREWPPPVMCFPYKQAAWRKFWMRNTPSPLDIIFCKAGKIVSIHKGEPFSTDMVGPNEATDFVVELPFGTAKKYAINIGDSVRIKNKIEYSEINNMALKFSELVRSH